jgi:RNase P subunit RPR2
MSVSIRTRVVLHCKKCKRILIVKTGRYLQAGGKQLQFTMTDGSPTLSGTCSFCGEPYRLEQADKSVEAAREENTNRC